MKTEQRSLRHSKEALGFNVSTSIPFLTSEGTGDIDELKDRVADLTETRQKLVDAITKAQDAMAQYDDISMCLKTDCDTMEDWLRGKVG